jgi:thiamine biosynthesis lipoprotein
MNDLGNKTSVFHRSVFAMNTRLDLVFWGGDDSTFEDAIRQINFEIEKIELTLSRFHTGSELYKINQLAFEEPVGVSEKMMNFIELAAHYEQATKGYFDVSLGSVFHQLKKGEVFEYCLSKGFSDRLKIDKANRTVRFLQPNISLDFGGMGKGIAIKAIAEILDFQEIQNAFVSFGGSSVLTRGHHPHGEFWPFCLADYPDYVWKLKDDCLSISSSHRNISGKSAVHIFNPFSTEMVTNRKTVVVQTNHPVEAEVLSTALIAAPMEEHLEILANFKPAKHFIFESN